MISIAGTLAAPFPYFGGKANACEQVWAAFGAVDNYVEAFAGSAAMLLGAPDGKRIATINDADGFRRQLLARHCRTTQRPSRTMRTGHATRWTCLPAIHGWCARHQRSRKACTPTRSGLTPRLPAGGAGVRATGSGPDGAAAPGRGFMTARKSSIPASSRTLAMPGRASTASSRTWAMPGRASTASSRTWAMPGRASTANLGDAGRGINRSSGRCRAGHQPQAPAPGRCRDAGNGEHPRRTYIMEWFAKLHQRLRDVRVTCGDWSRVVKDSVTTRHGLTGLFLDPPYTLGAMDYAVGGVGGDLATEVRAWCAANGQNQMLRIVLCGHKGEHDSLSG
jgi:hypothetical protein